MRIAVIIAILTITSASYAGGPVLPEPWRLPTKSELDASWRSASDRSASVSADFNADGLVDGAFVVLSADGARFGVVAFLSSKSGAERWFTIPDFPKYGYLNLGVREREPGTYRVYGPLGNDDPKVEIELKNHGFSFFQPESSSTLVVWSEADGRFEQHSESE